MGNGITNLSINLRAIMLIAFISRHMARLSPANRFRMEHMIRPLVSKLYHEYARMDEGLEFSFGDVLPKVEHFRKYTLQDIALSIRDFEGNNFLMWKGDLLPETR